MTQILNSKTFGEQSDKPTLVIAHGLYGSMRNWQGLARNLSGDRQVITVDMRNHAGSFQSDTHSYFDLANDLLSICRGVSGPVDLLGHSMGGKAAMVLALRYPDAINRLIVADISPVPYQHTPGDNIEIMQSLNIDRFERRSEAQTAMEPMVPDPAVRAFIAQSLILEPSGNYWAMNLDGLKNNMEHIVGFPTDITGVFSGNVIFLRGANSDYVKPEHHPIIFKLFPNAKVTSIPDSGHWVHAENPREFLRALKEFLGSN